jgi:hypothetical protein
VASRAPSPPLLLQARVGRKAALSDGRLAPRERPPLERRRLSRLVPAALPLGLGDAEVLDGLGFAHGLAREERAPDSSLAGLSVRDGRPKLGAGGGVTQWRTETRRRPTGCDVPGAGVATRATANVTPATSSAPAAGPHSLRVPWHGKASALGPSDLPPTGPRTEPGAAATAARASSRAAGKYIPASACKQFGPRFGPRRAVGAGFSPPQSPHLQALRGVSDGTRTRGRLDHNQELYQLSYAHQAGCKRV